MYLVFDTETNGLPISFKAPATDVDNWPRIVQLSWQLYDDGGNIINEVCELIKPDGWIIPATEIDKEGKEVDSFHKKNGRSTEQCEEKGIPLKELLIRFVDDMEKSKYLIAHNMDFDKNVISAEFIRYQVKPRNKPDKICTMKESTEYCKLKNNWSGYKWPSLVELHEKLFEEGFEGAHDALSDVKACARSFFELKKRGVLLKPVAKIHNLKTWPEYFELIKSGTKKFEVRKNDRDYSVGDTLVLEEYDNDTSEYTDRSLRVKVNYILRGGEFGVEEGYVVMSIL